MKVHFTIAGWDKERSIWGCSRLGADKIYVLIPEGEGEVNKKTAGVASSIKEKFSSLFQVEFIKVNYMDYAGSFKKVMKAMQKERGNELFVNISSGAHVITSALTFAASLMKCRAYYVVPERYDEALLDEDRFISYGGKEIVDIPLLPINSISGVESKLLCMIAEKGRLSVSDLSKEAMGIFTTHSRSKFNYYVDKLGDLGFLKNEMIGGKLFTSITESGIMMAQSLSYDS